MSKEGRVGSERRTEIDRIREEGGVKEVKKKKNEKSDGCLNHAKDRRVSCSKVTGER